MNNLIPDERIERKIYLIRRQKVMLDRDFMFQLTQEEKNELVTICDRFRPKGKWRGVNRE